MNLNQVTIPSINIERSVKFYETIGLKLIVQALPRYARFLCPEEDATFSVHLVDCLPKGDGITVYFESDKLDELVAQLKKKGINFISDPEDKPWLWREAQLEDPDGNKIILYHAGKNRKDPPWRIN